jgi:hypothetical protein
MTSQRRKEVLCGPLFDNQLPPTVRKDKVHDTLWSITKLRMHEMLKMKAYATKSVHFPSQRLHLSWRAHPLSVSTGAVPTRPRRGSLKGTSTDSPPCTLEYIVQPSLFQYSVQPPLIAPVTLTTQVSLDRWPRFIQQAGKSSAVAYPYGLQHGQ